MRAWVGAVALMLSACHDPMSPAESALASAESRWNASRPASNSYVFDQVRNCFCVTGGVRHAVTVVNGNITGVRNLATGIELPADQRTWFRTVAQLFDDIRGAIRRRGSCRPPSTTQRWGTPRAHHSTRSRTRSTTSSRTSPVTLCRLLSPRHRP